MRTLTEINKERMALRQKLADNFFPKGFKNKEYTIAYEVAFTKHIEDDPVYKVLTMEARAAKNNIELNRQLNQLKSSLA